MKIRNAAALTAAMAMMATPAFAYSGTDNPGSTHRADPTPGPSATLPAKAKAYGRYCKTETKTHVEGQKGTNFSKCVTAMAKLANSSKTNPTTACKTESKKHVEGQKGTPFSKCVSGGAKLLKDQAAADNS